MSCTAVPHSMKSLVPTTEQRKMEMVTIVDKNEYKKLMDYVRDIDPKAFVTVYSVSDMRYMPKK